MAPSYRDASNKGLENHISVDRKSNGVIYYSYRLPNGRKKSIKRPAGASDAVYKQHANTMARKISHQLGRDNPTVDASSLLNDYVMASTGIDKTTTTIESVLVLFKRDFLPQRRHSKSTLTEKHRLCRFYTELWGNRSIYDISLNTLTQQLDTLTNAAYIKHRGFWIDVYRFAISRGHQLDNQAEKTLTRTAARTKRKRLKPEWYKAIRSVAPEWLQRAMDFALLTLQRRADLVEIMKNDIYPANLLPEYEIHFSQDKDGAEIVDFELIGYYWTHPTTQDRTLVAKTSYRKALDAADDLNRQHNLTGRRQLVVIQNKTVKHGDKACIVIELDDAMEEVIAQCCQTDIASPNLIHYRPKRVTFSKAKHWSAVTPKYFSVAFAEARDSLPLFQKMKEDERPTLHEIRALGGKLYEEKYGKEVGKSIANSLMGHTSFKMTDHYLDGHRVEFTKAGAHAFEK